MGSPPRGRGKDICRHPFAVETRITPAWAGKSSLYLVPVRASRDHPRVGGEKLPGAGYAYNDRGSPPRGRGKEIMVTLQDINARITPAWAGKRSSSNVPGQVYWDHPRVGGEKLALSPLLDVLKGSPPRGRGKDHVAEVIAHGTGITPAWAGKSSPGPYPLPRPWDHPRVGGEKL